jgi:hypothetical protein
LDFQGVKSELAVPMLGEAMRPSIPTKGLSIFQLKVTIGKFVNKNSCFLKFAKLEFLIPIFCALFKGPFDLVPNALVHKGNEYKKHCSKFFKKH